MKNWSICQRLLGLVGFLLLALLIGVSIFYRADYHESAALERRERLLTTAVRIRFDMLQLSDAMRGLLLDATSATDRERLNSRMPIS